MKSKNLTYLVIALLLIAFGVLSRLGMIDWPNFKPVAAIALFSGFLFQRYWISIGVVIGIMLISDFQLGSSDWKISAAVYACLLMFIGMGRFIYVWESKRQKNKTVSTGDRILWNLSAFAGASLVMSCLFFGLSNAAFWWCSGIYPFTMGGLLSCYEAGIPFFRWTLLGDLSFTMALVCVYQSVLLWVHSFEDLPFEAVD